MKIRNLDGYSYKQWERGLVTPISDETLRRWQYRSSVREKWAGSNLWVFRPWQKGKVTPINDQILKKWEIHQFKLSMLKYYGVNKRKYTIHWLFPREYLLNDSFSIDNIVPLTNFTHEILHSTYNKQELLMDPVGLVITVLEDSFRRAGEINRDPAENIMNKKELRKFKYYQYVLWRQGKVTPISDDILKNWMYNRSQGEFRSIYAKYKRGKVTPIKDSIKRKFDYFIVRENILKANSIGQRTKKYTIHHLLPNHLFPDRFTDPDNCIPLINMIHKAIHKEYHVLELIIDPITPVIMALKSSFIFNSTGDNMNSLKVVNKAIEDLIQEFNKRPDYFFNEHDLHHVFYCKLTSLGDLIHPEYPTKKRFIRIRGKKTDETYEDGVHCFEPDVKKGRRGHYDFVVLNETFYNQNREDFDKLSNSTVDINKDIDYPYIDIAIEFKYITGTFDQREIEYDRFKLKKANEVLHKKLIIFTKPRKGKNYDSMRSYLDYIEGSGKEIQIEVING
jgi:hypothetical protein